MGEINILFLGGAKRVSVAERFVNEGKRHKVEVSIFSYEIHNEVPIACVGKVIKGLKWNSESIIKHLKEVINKYEINIILPFVDPAIEICSLLKKEVGNSVSIPVSSEFVCQTMFDKKKAAMWFKKYNFPIPKTYNLHNIKFPAILKPSTGSAAKGLIIVNNEREFNIIHNPDEYLIQEYIEDNIEYTVDAYISRNKEVLTTVPRIRLETAGGEVTRSITTNNRRIIELSNQILCSDEFYGPITVQFLHDCKMDKLYVMEINPRLGGGVVLSIEAGANIPEMIIREHLGFSVEVCNNWKSGVLMTRYFKEVFYANNN